MTPESESEARARHERETKATALAVDQARRDERTKARLDGHDRELTEVRATASETSSKLDGVVATLNKIEQAVATQAAVAAAGLSNRTFWLGVAAVIASIAAIFIGTGH